MKTHFAIAVLFLLSQFLSADSWAPPTPFTVSSPEGKYLLRAIPPQHVKEEGGNRSKMLFIVYQLDHESQDYRETNRFNVEGHPIQIMINDQGDRIVTLDQYFGIGRGSRVVAVYDSKGRELKTWALEDFYDKEKVKELPKSTSSVHWRGEVSWMHGQQEVWISKAESRAGKDVEFDNYVLDVKSLKISKRVYPK